MIYSITTLDLPTQTIIQVVSLDDAPSAMSKTGEVSGVDSN